MNSIQSMRASWLCFGLLALVACGNDQVVDGGESVDAGQLSDAILIDGGESLDGATALDGDEADAAVVPDAGTKSDVAGDVTLADLAEDASESQTDAAPDSTGDATAQDGGAADTDDGAATADTTADTATGPDAAGAEPMLCNPCGASKECATTADPKAACVSLGSNGAFCGIACSSDSDCESDYICSETTSVEGVKSKQCVRAKDKGECGCSKTAAAQGLTTSCYAEDPNGTIMGQCPGTRSCSDKGLSACSAQAPTKELCEGSDDDCDGQTDEDTCDDGEPCTKDVCEGNKGCSNTAITSACNDGDACTEKDSCAKGKCAGSALKCDDGNPCTDDSCDKAKGCVNLDNNALCDDGDKCTNGDGCQNGTCAPGASATCDDNNVCTTDACDAKTGACDFAANVTPTSCDDGNKCTGDDACSDGKCSGSGVACDDNDPCTDDACDPKKGCLNTENTGFCDDGDACTSKDVCKKGSCGGASITCDDGKVCTDDSCDKDAGCTTTANAATCDDGDSCTKDDVCSESACTGTKLDCDDGKICTDDSCDKDKGCVTKVNAAPCDDGDSCTEKDYCNKGSCGGANVTCDDGNSCTDDSCDKDKGCVTSQNTAGCDDGNKCSAKDSCAGGVCKAGKSKVCDDKDACTADSCEPLTGKCVYKAVSNCKACSSAKQCDDGNGCTTETCVGGKCQGASRSDGAACDDGSYCTSGDSCLGGSCKPGKTAKCDDKNPCTVDLCDSSAKKCSNSPLARGFKCGTKKVRDDFKCVGASVYKRAGFPGCSGSATMPKCSELGPDLAYTNFVKVATCSLPKICRIEASGGFCGLPKKPDLLITGFKLDKSTYLSGSWVKVTWTVKNAGIVASPKVRLGFYVSTDNKITGKDLYKGASTLGPIKAGATMTGTYSVILRSNLGKSVRYVGAIVDSLNAAQELNETNNTAMQKITTTPAGDIWVSSSSRPQYSSISWGRKLSYYRYVRNYGTVTVGKSTSTLWLSADGKVDKSDIALLSEDIGVLKPGQYVYGWKSFTMPTNVKPGTWYLIYQADANNAVAEGNESNNYRVTKITYNGFIDLDAVGLSVSATVATGSAFPVKITGKNTGNTKTVTFYDRVYLSKDKKYGGDQYLGYATRKSVAAGATYTSTLNLTLSTKVAPGPWYLIYVTDSSNRVRETNETNNIKVVPIQVFQAPNLRTYNLRTQSSIAYVNSLLRWYSYDRNYGAKLAGKYELRYYLSTNKTWDKNDLQLATMTRGPLKPLQVQSTSASWKIPATYKPGKYWLIAKTDALNQIAESNEKDNVSATPFEIRGRPDLVGGIEAVTTTMTAGTKVKLNLSWENIGTTSARQHYDRVYINTKKAYGGTYLGQFTRATLASQKSGKDTAVVTLSSSLRSGTYYLNYRVDSLSRVAESNEGNNTSYQKVTIVALPDLYFYYSRVSTGKPSSGQTISLVWGVRNGYYGTSKKTTVRFLLSKDTKVSKDDIKLGESDVIGLKQYKTTLGNVKLTIPKTVTGSWRLLMMVDPDNTVLERSDANNLRYINLTISAAPDIAVSALTVTPTKAKVGTQVKITATHKNLGNLAADYTAALYLVTSSKTSIKLMEKLQPTLGAGKTASTTESAVIPGTVKPGTYKLRWVVTAKGDSNGSNNSKEVTLTVL